MNHRSSGIRSTRAGAPLKEDQIEVLRSYGQTRETEAGQVLFRAGDSSNDFFVILEGDPAARSYVSIATIGHQLRSSERGQGSVSL